MGVTMPITRKTFWVDEGEKYELPVSVVGDARGGWSIFPAPCTGLFVSMGTVGYIVPKKELVELMGDTTETMLLGAEDEHCANCGNVTNPQCFLSSTDPTVYCETCQENAE